MKQNTKDNTHVEGFTGGEWEIDDSSVIGSTIWADSRRDEGICIATVYDEDKQHWQANAALIAQAKNMYYALKEAKAYLYALLSWQTDKDKEDAIKKEISNILAILQKANPKP